MAAALVDDALLPNLDAANAASALFSAAFVFAIARDKSISSFVSRRSSTLEALILPATTAVVVGGACVNRDDDAAVAAAGVVAPVSGPGRGVTEVEVEGGRGVVALEAGAAADCGSVVVADTGDCNTAASEAVCCC